MDTDQIITIRGLTKIYSDGVEVRALDGLDMNVASGEFLAIVGPSGSGKSTLLHMIGILDTPTSGTVVIDGQDVTQMTEMQRSQARNRLLGFIFQYHHLLPDFTALENVMMPILIAGKRRDEAEKEAISLLGQVNLSDRLHHYPNQLSGGQNQRVAVARALANRPRIIIGDEPTGNLDSHSSDMVYELLRKLNREMGQTFILVTHDENMAKKTDRIIRIVDGKIVDS
ncbi:lipoprotein-releasing system ATP-binding protein [Methanohalophilus levihalophilus]|uniref:ABC transporter ATP-binding protein n=1 Tax=Methanohalophilus levihalophilus TaxID=1431282 RepID=UPI001AE365FB|nr:ABC transporter ATP-binding protein [Methanohalophilus levihalophilus]MBP2029872.1 lipoprotein-releasing system ATP-binding protein [Methanohalophilus levihalophilus]